MAISSGSSLLIGFLTPVAGAIVGLGGAGIALSWFPAGTSNLLDGRLATFLMIVVAVSVIFLGPGAYSLDCYLFGRREIIIPPSQCRKS